MVKRDNQNEDNLVPLPSFLSYLPITQVNFLTGYVIPINAFTLPDMFSLEDTQTNIFFPLLSILDRCHMHPSTIVLALCFINLKSFEIGFAIPTNWFILQLQFWGKRSIKRSDQWSWPPNYSRNKISQHNKIEARVTLLVMQRLTKEKKKYELKFLQIAWICCKLKQKVEKICWCRFKATSKNQVSVEKRMFGNL